MVTVKIKSLVIHDNRGLGRSSKTVILTTYGKTSAAVVINNKK